MNMLSVEQAVFTSSDRGPMKGYQLVSKSPGIDRNLTQELCRWGPTKGASENPEDWTLHCFPITDDFVAIARTTLGGPEYSGRGGTQVVTIILVFRNEQLEPFAFNPIAVAQTAMAMGYLKLPLEMEREPLPCATLPSGSLIERRGASHDYRTSENCEQLLNKAASLIEDERRLAIIGPIDPIATVDRLIQRLPLESRSGFSFTTGLPQSVRRPFQLHFFATADLTTRRALESQDMVCLMTDAHAS